MNSQRALSPGRDNNPQT
jgi:hypothetical protein